MRIGMIGLGRMGANMVRRLLQGGHECVAYDPRPEAVQAVAAYGAQAARSPQELVRLLSPPRAVWIMVPAAMVDAVLAQLRPLLAAGDVLVDGGNSNYHDDIRRAGELEAAGIRYLDVGTSGGVLGFEQGYCLMIGGEAQAVALLAPALATLAPGGRLPAAAGGTAAGAAAASLGYLHCGPHGAGHFVKMVHNGIEYGLMAAYAEGLNVLAHADAGLRTSHRGRPGAGRQTRRVRRARGGLGGGALDRGGGGRNRRAGPGAERGVVFALRVARAG